MAQHFLRFPFIVQTESQSDDRATVVFTDGSRVSIFAAHPDDFAATLFAETGSKEHVSENCAACSSNRLPAQALKNKFQRKVQSKDK